MITGGSPISGNTRLVNYDYNIWIQWDSYAIHMGFIWLLGGIDMIITWLANISRIHIRRDGMIILYLYHSESFHLNQSEKLNFINHPQNHPCFWLGVKPSLNCRFIPGFPKLQTWYYTYKYMKLNNIYIYTYIFIYIL